MYRAPANAWAARAERSPRLPMGVATTTRRPLPGACPAASEARSDVEADLEYVAIDDFILLALDPQLARLSGPGPGTELEQFVPVDHLGPDEPSLQVRMDHPGTLGGFGPGPERPGPALLVAGGEERAPAQQPVGRLRHTRQRARSQPQALH